MPKPYTPNDRWSQRAAKEGYRARSVYKLKELDERFHLLKPGMTVLDLGAAPGSWLQYAVKKIGSKGMAIGMDLEPIEPLEGAVHTFQCDITDTAAVAAHLKRAGIEKVDLVLSDLAPSTSGIKDVDQWRSVELSQAVVETAKKFLNPGGLCVLKILRGADFDAFMKEMKQTWKDVRTARPKATRDRSSEVYVIAKQ